MMPVTTKYSSFTIIFFCFTNIPINKSFTIIIVDFTVTFQAKMDICKDRGFIKHVSYLSQLYYSVFFGLRQALFAEFFACLSFSWRIAFSHSPWACLVQLGFIWFISNISSLMFWFLFSRFITLTNELVTAAVQ